MSLPYFVLVETNGTFGRLMARRARETGLVRPVVLTLDPSWYEYAAQDGLETIRTDTLDDGQVARTCRELGSVAAVAAGYEYMLPRAARVAQQLGLHSQDPLALERCVDKLSQREWMDRCGISQPKFRPAQSVQEAIAAAEEVKLPAVLKPRKSGGSIGTRLCVNRAEVASQADHLLSWPGNERGFPAPRGLLVEEYVPGALATDAYATPEDHSIAVSVEVFGETVVGVTRQHYGPPPWFVDQGSDFPADLPPDVIALASEAGLLIAAAAGLREGPKHIELRIRFRNGKPVGYVLIELNPRLAGGNYTEVFRHASSVDMVEATVKWLMTGVEELGRRANRHAVIRYLLPDAKGTVTEVLGLEQARMVPGVVQIHCRVKPLDPVSLNHDARDHLGYVVAVADDYASATRAADTARSMVRVNIQ